MKTAEHRVFAKPALWWLRASPGGGSYSVESSNEFARAARNSWEPGVRPGGAVGDGVAVAVLGGTRVTVAVGGCVAVLVGVVEIVEAPVAVAVEAAAPVGVRVGASAGVSVAVADGAADPVGVALAVGVSAGNSGEMVSTGGGSPQAAQRKSRNPATTQLGLGIDPLLMKGSGVAASPARVADRIVTPPLQRRRDIGRHAVSLDVTEEEGSRVRGSRRERGRPARCAPTPRCMRLRAAIALSCSGIGLRPAN